MKLRATWIPAILASLLAAQAAAQSRGEGWEVGAQLVYQDSQDIAFKRGMAAALEDDVGLVVDIAYRFNERFEVEFCLAWNSIEYDVSVASVTVPGLAFAARGDLETFAPRVSANFNLLQGPLTPYVKAGIGWSFIDTNS